MNFQNLVDVIAETQKNLQGRALRSVDHFLTMRNWLTGCYIVEYEQKGNDRAKYGERLLEKLSEELHRRKLPGMSLRSLKLFRQFYCSYPQIGQSVIAQFKTTDIRLSAPIGQSLSAQLTGRLFTGVKSLARLNQPLGINSTKPELLLRHLTFTHFARLLVIDEPIKRSFYEVESIKGNWNVRYLKRQIESLLYERTGLSKNKTALLAKVHNQNDIPTPDDIIKDPYILEFTGLKERPEYSENDLETALLNHIQEFLLELGNGLCFEARQKRITIDDEHDRVDLVLYHRILRCHVLIDLKTRAFSHVDVGQMNFYLNYFKENVMSPGDNPPVGLILCAGKTGVKVKYATTGLDNKLFVSKYLVALPSEKELEDFLSKDREFLEG